MLGGIVLVAALYRLAALDSLPPGLNQDEALSAWNAWCLLHTGRAMTGEPWPIFHCRNIGDHPTMLFFYVLMPFQAIGGLEVWTTRLPVALAGVGSTALLGWLGARLFRPAVGLLAAALFAVAPWSTFVGRFGVGAGLSPLQALLPIGALLLAGYRVGDGPTRPIRPAWALVAGLTAGIAGYGFHSLRPYMPLLLAGTLLVTAGGFQHWRATTAGRVALACLGLGFLSTFGPLAWASATDPAMMARWQMTRLWTDQDGIFVRIGMIAQRWIIHFDPGFLFLHGDPYPTFTPFGQGELGWYVLPGLVAGILFAASAVRRSATARLLLLLVGLYPVGDLVSRYDGPHLLRSALGLPSLLLASAWGTVEGLRRLRTRAPAAGALAAACLAVAALAQEALYARSYFVDYPRQWEIQMENQVGLLDAARWLRPRLREAEGVFCTTTGTNEPFAILLVGLRYDAAQWMKDVKIRREGEYDTYGRVGKLHFIYGPEAEVELRALRASRPGGRVVFLVRPGQLGLSAPVARFKAPDGREVLWACEERL